MRLPATIAAALLALPCAAIAQPAPQDQPTITREPDGSFTINRTIEAEAPATVAHGLVEIAGGSPARAGPARSEAKRARRAKAEEDLQRAYEEAVDWARPRP